MDIVKKIFNLLTNNTTSYKGLEVRTSLGELSSENIQEFTSNLDSPTKVSLQTETPIPEDFDFSDEFKAAFDLMENTSKHLFITGKAGTGKSTLLQYFKLNTKKKIAVLAPTGVAAIKVHGQTIHSFFHLPPRFIQKSHIKRLRKEDLIKNLDAIVIDEASMLRADLLDGIDYALRVNRDRLKIPFGGVRVIIFGDLFQLPPVVDKSMKDVMKKTYKSPFFFDAKVIKETGLENFLLTKIYRQKDERFIALLNKVREKEFTDTDLEEINKRVDSNAEVGTRGVITLMTTNNGAKNVNEQCLLRIKDQEYQYNANINGKFDEDEYPAEACLRLKKGAQVMLIKNDTDKSRRWVNGTLAEVVDLSQTRIKVNIKGSIYEVPKVTWEKVEYFYNEKEKKIEEIPVAYFEQFPLKLAWAVTIHKSQGQTFERVMIDMERGAFAHGQVYVALSRCISLEGITLKKSIIYSDIILDERIYRFLNKTDTDLKYNQGEETIEEKPTIKTNLRPKYSKGNFVKLENDEYYYTIEHVYEKNQDGEFEYRGVSGVKQKIIKESDIKEALFQKFKGVQGAPNKRVNLILTSDAFANDACLFDINVDSTEAEDLVLKINRWVYTKVRSHTAERKLTVVSPLQLRLEIAGQGHDNRCRWCRTFRTGLKTACEDRFGPDAFLQENTCQYE